MKSNKREKLIEVGAYLLLVASFILMFLFNKGKEYKVITYYRKEDLSRNPPIKGKEPLIKGCDVPTSKPIPFNINSDPSFMVKGVVKDENGRGISKAVVKFLPVLFSALEVSDTDNLGVFPIELLEKGINKTNTVTDNLGRFVLRDLKTRDGELYVIHPEFCLSHQKLNLSPPEGGVLNITLSHGTKLNILVKDREGFPVDGAEISFYSLDNNLLLYQGTTDKRGEFIPEVEFCEDLVLKVKHREYIPYEAIVNFSSVEENNKYIEIRLKRGELKICGRVLTDKGFPLEGVEVKLQFINFARLISVLSFTDLKGNFCFYPEKISYPLRVTLFHPQFYRIERWFLKESELKDITIKYPEGTKLYLQVRDEDTREVLNNFQLYLFYNGLKLEGEFNKDRNEFLFVLPIIPGNLVAVIKKEGYVSKREILDIWNGNNYEIREILMKRGVSVEGTIVNEWGDKMKDVLVTVYNSRLEDLYLVPLRSRGEGITVSDEFGRFIIKGIPFDLNNIVLNLYHPCYGTKTELIMNRTGEDIKKYEISLNKKIGENCSYSQVYSSGAIIKGGKVNFIIPDSEIWYSGVIEGDILLNEYTERVEKLDKGKSEKLPIIMEFLSSKTGDKYFIFTYEEVHYYLK